MKSHNNKNGEDCLLDVNKCIFCKTSVVSPYCCHEHFSLRYHFKKRPALNLTLELLILNGTRGLNISSNKWKSRLTEWGWVDNIGNNSYITEEGKEKAGFLWK